MKHNLFILLIIGLILSFLMVSCDVDSPNSNRNQNSNPSGGDSGGSQGGSNSNNGGTGAGTSCYNPIWDKNFADPHYVIHAIGHGTTDGPVADDWWFLFGVAPQNNSVSLPDGSGGSFTYSTDYQSGPYNTPREVCNAEGARLGDRTMSAWQSWNSWNCKEILACNETANSGQTQGQEGQGGTTGGNQNGGNQGNTQSEAFTAWLQCGDFLDIDPGQVSKPCAVCVSGWESNTAVPVSVTFPPLADIVVSPGSTAADPGNMFNTGTSDHPEYCFDELYRTDEPGQRQVVIPIQVQQGGGAPINLSLTVNVMETFDGYPFRVCPEARSVSLTTPIFNWNRDWIDNAGVNADGIPDTFFSITVTASDERAEITYISLQLTDINGSPLGGEYPRWDTMPNADRYMAVFNPSTNQWLNQPDGSITAAVTAGSVNLTLDINDPEGYFYDPNIKALVTVEFGNNLDCTATAVSP